MLTVSQNDICNLIVSRTLLSPVPILKQLGIKEVQPNQTWCSVGFGQAVWGILLSVSGGRDGVTVHLVMQDHVQLLFSCCTVFSPAPEGIPAPVLSIVSTTALRVTWIVPDRPNGDITAYNLIVNGETVATGSTQPGSMILNELQPYTVYDVQVRSCGVKKCVKQLFEVNPVCLSPLRTFPIFLSQLRTFPVFLSQLRTFPVVPSANFPYFIVQVKTLSCLLYHG